MDQWCEDLFGKVRAFRKTRKPKPTTSKGPPKRKSPKKSSIIAVSHGVGVDSTAMMIKMIQRKIPMDYCIFADTGAEKPFTYESARIVHEYLKYHGYPTRGPMKGCGLMVVKYEPPKAHYRTLTGQLLRTDQLPALAYGKHGCSIKWKHGPIDAFLLTQDNVVKELDAGKRVVRVIGYDNSDADRARWRRWRSCGRGKNHWDTWYPLQQARWGTGKDKGIEREEAIEIIQAEMGDEFLMASLDGDYFGGHCDPRKQWLDNPGKSACYYCPAAHPDEVVDLFLTEQDLAFQALAIEYRCKTGKVGLKGTTGLGRSWSWAEFLKKVGLIRSDWKKTLSSYGVNMWEDDPHGDYAGYIPPGWPAYRRRVTAMKSTIDAIEGPCRDKAKVLERDWGEYKKEKFGLADSRTVLGEILQPTWDERRDERPPDFPEETEDGPYYEREPDHWQGLVEAVEGQVYVFRGKDRPAMTKYMKNPASQPSMCGPGFC